MNIKLNQNQTVILKNAIQTANNLYRGNFKDALDWIFELDTDTDLCLKIRDLVSDNYLDKDVLSCDIENISDNKETIFDLCNKLDLVIRVALGQWGELNKLNLNTECLFMDSEKESQLFNLRNELIPIFEEKGVVSLGASFGIHSEEVKDKIRVVYDIFKVLMFENGAGGVYGDQPYAISNEPLPEITLVEKEFDNISEDDLKQAKKLCEKHKYYEDKVGLYLPVEEYRQILTKIGDNIKLKRNGYWIVTGEGV